jgi:hypothetical protein
MPKAKKNGAASDAVVTMKPSKSRGKRKLSDDQVLAIVSAYLGRGKGPTMKAIAEDYDVTVGTVSAILRGRTYVWLTNIGFAPLAAAA